MENPDTTQGNQSAKTTVDRESTAVSSLASVQKQTPTARSSPKMPSTDGDLDKTTAVASAQNPQPPTPPRVPPPKPPVLAAASTGQVFKGPDPEIPQNFSTAQNVVFAMVGQKVSLGSVSAVPKQTVWGKVKGVVKKLVFTDTGRLRTVPPPRGRGSEASYILDEDVEAEEFAFDEVEPADDQSCWEYDNLGESSHCSRVGVFSTLNRAIDHAFGTAVCFLGGGKVKCSGSYARVLWEVGDVYPNFAMVHEGELKTFVVKKWRTINSKKTPYVILKYGVPYSSDGWVSFKTSTNRRLLLKTELVEKENLHFVRFRDVSEFEGHTVYAIRDGMNPFSETFADLISEEEPHSELRIVETVLKTFQKRPEQPDINFYDIPTHWIQDPKVPPIVKDFVASLLPERTFKVPIPVASEDDRFAFFYASACRLQKEFLKLGDSDRVDICEKIKKTFEHGDLGEKRRICVLFDTYSTRELEEEIVARLGTRKMIHPVDPVRRVSGGVTVSFDYEGLSYDIPATSRGHYPLLLGHRLLIGGLSKHAQVLVDALQTQACRSRVLAQRVEFDFYLESTLKSITTNARQAAHGYHVYGEFWRERCAYQGTYRGVWFQSDEDDPNAERLVRMVNNQLVAELTHGALRPDDVALSNEPFELVTLELTSKSTYLDSFEVSSSGEVLETALFGWSAKMPLSGEGRRFSTNFVEVLSAFPVKFVDEVPYVTVKGCDGVRDFEYEGHWRVDLYNPEATTLRNFETMFKVEASSTGLQVLLNPAAAATQKPATPDAVVEARPVREAAATTTSQGKKKKEKKVVQAQATARERPKPPPANRTEAKAPGGSVAPPENLPPDASRKTSDDGGKSPGRQTSSSNSNRSAWLNTSVVPERARDLLGHHANWLTAIRENIVADRTWDNLCHQAQIVGKAKADLESDLHDWLSGKDTARQVGDISRFALDLFLSCYEPDKVKQNLTPLHQRKRGKLPTQFTAEK